MYPDLIAAFKYIRLYLKNGSAKGLMNPKNKTFIQIVSLRHKIKTSLLNDDN